MKFLHKQQQVRGWWDCLVGLPALRHRYCLVVPWSQMRKPHREGDPLLWVTWLARVQLEPRSLFGHVTVVH